MAMIQTIHGDMDEAGLEKRTGRLDNENERTTWTEYWLAGELVHRSAHVHLKRPVVAISAIGGF